MTHPVVQLVIGHRWSGTDDPQSLASARAAILGQLAILVTGSKAASNTSFAYAVYWLEHFVPAHSTFFFGVHEDSIVISDSEPTIAAQAPLVMWRVDTAFPDGKEWTATFSATGYGHEPANEHLGGPVPMSLTVEAVRALLMATLKADAGANPEFRLARRELLQAVRNELAINNHAPFKDWIRWMPETVFREYELLRPIAPDRRTR